MILFEGGSYLRRKEAFKARIDLGLKEPNHLSQHPHCNKKKTKF